MEAHLLLIASAKRKIKEAGSDLAALTAIENDLEGLTGIEARGLRIRIGSLKLQITRQTKSTTVKTILSRNNLATPDKDRPLFKYAIDDDEFETLKAYLNHVGRYGYSLVGGEVSALFVLWCAHWFQRKYRGGHRRWRDIAEALEVDFQDNDARRLAQEGLKTWQRPVRGDSTRQWLMTLAVEGGFPARILEESDRWLAPYLSRVVGTLLASETVDAGTAFAAAEKEVIYTATAYRQDIFYALAADLAAAIVHFRQKAEIDKPRGVSASEWLDATQPDWRKSLPITTSVDSAARLVDGLMQADASKLLGDKTVGCDRLLRKRDGIWRPAIQLSSDGIAKAGLLKELSGRTQRIRAFPTAVFAKYSSGEIAIFEPPGTNDEGWRVRPSRGDSIVQGVPFTVPISIQFRCDGSPIGQSTIWPHGVAIRSEIGVFASDLVSSGAGSTLKLIGTGSGVFKPTIVFVAIPHAWTIEADGAEDQVDALDDLSEDGRRLWRIKGTAILRSSENDRYRIVSDGASSSPDELTLDGAAPLGVDSEESEVELFAGAPTVRLCDDGRHREPHSSEIRWRPDGERFWRPFPLAHGRVEIAWIDPKTDFIRDRRRLFILPIGARLEQRRISDGMAYTPIGFDAKALRSADDNLTVQAHDNVLLAHFIREPARRARFMLSSGDSRPLMVSAPYLMGTGLAKWSGVRVSGGRTTSTAAKISLAELAEYVAFADGRQCLHAGLLDRQRRRLDRSAQRWNFTDELPMRGIADELFSILSPFADIDVFAELTLQNGMEYWHIQQFEMTLALQMGHLRITNGFSRNSEIELFGRPVEAPWEERHLASWSSAAQMDGRTPAMPDNLRGEWIVYGRRNETVTSRPIIMVFGHNSNVDIGLAAAARIADVRSRNAAIQQCFEGIALGAPGSDDDVAWLLKLCSNLRGLPPGSFDALQALSSYHCVAARVALRASNDEMRAVLDIADGLPFAWFVIPVDTWKSAADLERKVSRSLLLKGVGEPLATELSRRAIDDAVMELAAIDPLLAWPLMAATGVAAKQMPMRRTLTDAAQDHIRRYGDQLNTAVGGESLFRLAFPAEMPTEFDRFDPIHLEALDAPCAAALAAARSRSLDSTQIRRIKAAARSDTIYFSEAFDARFVQLMNR
jgi:hypothetical protein